MTAAVAPGLAREIVEVLRDAGAVFALLHGSRAAGTHGPDSDVDVAAWWGAGRHGVLDPALAGRMRFS